MTSSEQISCDLADEAVILNLKDGVYYGLNAVAARVWELVQEPRTVREIRDVVQREYAVDEETCERDLFQLLLQLQDWKLVELRNGTKPIDPD